jgi:hypothetical protein
MTLSFLSKLNAIKSLNRGEKGKQKVPTSNCFSFDNMLVHAQFLYFFISGRASGGRVTGTDGDCRIYYTIMNMSLHNSYNSY